jgi:hypothetical protein
MNGSGCARRVLAANDFMQVEQCSCGSVHVTIGAVTLRLQSGAIPALAATFTDAARTMALAGALTSHGSTSELLS